MCVKPHIEVSGYHIVAIGKHDMQPHTNNPNTHHVAIACTLEIKSRAIRSGKPLAWEHIYRGIEKIDILFQLFGIEETFTSTPAPTSSSQWATTPPSLAPWAWAPPWHTLPSLSPIAPTLLEPLASTTRPTPIATSSILPTYA